MPSIHRISIRPENRPPPVQCRLRQLRRNANRSPCQALHRFYTRFCGNVGGRSPKPVRVPRNLPQTGGGFGLYALCRQRLVIPPFLPQNGASRRRSPKMTTQPPRRVPAMIDTSMSVKTPELERQAAQRLAADLPPENRNSLVRAAYAEANSGI